MVRINKEPGAAPPFERCCFCRKPTVWWTTNTKGKVTGDSVACCDVCAPKHDRPDVPSKKEWMAKERLMTQRLTEVGPGDPGFVFTRNQDTPRDQVGVVLGAIEGDLFNVENGLLNARQVPRLLALVREAKDLCKSFMAVQWDCYCNRSAKSPCPKHVACEVCGPGHPAYYYLEEKRTGRNIPICGDCAK
jgi:hypothetical protein